MADKKVIENPTNVALIPDMPRQGAARLKASQLIAQRPDPKTYLTEPARIHRFNSTRLWLLKQQHDKKNTTNKDRFANLKVGQAQVVPPTPAPIPKEQATGVQIDNEQSDKTTMETTSQQTRASLNPITTDSPKNLENSPYKNPKFGSDMVAANGKPVGYGNPPAPGQAQRAEMPKSKVVVLKSIEYVMSLLEETLPKDLEQLTPLQRVELWKDLQAYMRPKLSRMEAEKAPALNGGGGANSGQPQRRTIIIQQHASPTEEEFKKLSSGNEEVLEEMVDEIIEIAATHSVIEVPETTIRTINGENEHTTIVETVENGHIVQNISTQRVIPEPKMEPEEADYEDISE